MTSYNYDKLITTNFVRGHGGEFFINLLHEAIYDYEIKKKYPVVIYPEINRYGFEYTDIIFQTKFNNISAFLGSNYSTFEDYFKYEKAYPNQYEDKKLIVRKYEQNLEYYYRYIKDENKELELKNLKKYCDDVIHAMYLNFRKKFNLYTFSFLHYNNFLKPINYFFPESKNINLVNTKVDEYFFTLLYVYKKLPEIKYYPYITFYSHKNIPSMTKENLIKYFVFKKVKEYKSYDHELSVESFDFYFNNLNIDEQLSDLLGMKIRLNYDKVRYYAEKNRSLMIDIFDYDIFKSYDEEYVYNTATKFIDRVYDEI